MAEQEQKDKDAEPATEDSTEQKQPMDPVRKWTLITLVACVVLLIWYLIADRITPYTSQARVHALVVPIASEVSGTVIDVEASNNQLVSAGEVLFNIERDRYEFALETAQANLQTAIQATGVSTANVDAAAASLESAQANLIRAEQDAERLERIRREDPGAMSVRRLEQAEATLAVAQAQVRAAEANLEKARQDLGVAGEDNARILEAQAAVERAQIDLLRTTIIAPDDGLVTDVRVDRGNFASAGTPQMTFVATHNVWVQADFTENNLGHLSPGDPVEIVFDSLPGRVIEGRVRSMGYGVDVGSAPLGSLPTIENNQQWVRDAQRFPVVVDFELEDQRERLAIRVGSQASVVVYTGGNWLFNLIAKFNIRVASLLTYAF